MVQLTTDLAVSLREDRPGVLARVCEAVAAAGVSIEGFAEMDGVLHFVSSNAAAAQKAVEAAGFLVQKQETLLVALHHRPGELAGTLRVLADAGVNVRFSYLATGIRAVFGVSDVAKAQAALDRP